MPKASQNQIAAMISFPVQNNVNFGYGPNVHCQNVFNIQPVVPFGLNKQQTVNARLGAYCNAIRPDIGPEWQLRFQIQLLFPR
jgi:hypothetical protein